MPSEDRDREKNMEFDRNTEETLPPENRKKKIETLTETQRRRCHQRTESKQRH